MYQNFAEERIADGAIVMQSQGGPMFSTQVQRSFSGAEQRNANWDVPLGKWDLGERSLTQTQLDALNIFIRVRMGRLIGFRFKDWADFSVKATDGVLVRETDSQKPAGSFQLYKKYATSTAFQLRKIAKPVEGTVRVFRDSLPVEAYVDYTTGSVRLENDPGAGVLSWTGEFDVPVRFDVDHAPSRFIGYDPKSKERLHSLLSVPVTELRL